MSLNLLLGLSTMGLCLFLQSLLILVAIRYYSRRARLVGDRSYLHSLIVINGVMVLMVIGNLVQVGIWAVLFQLLGEFEQFDNAYYHAMVNFSTLGYGDIVMSEAHRLLGPLQAINGVLMIGVSTAILMATFQDAVKKTIKAREQEHK